MRRFTPVVETSLQKYMKERDEILRSVRAVKSNGKTVVGFQSSYKNAQMVQFESSLEKDFIRMVEFQTSVDRYVSQPLKIEYLDDEGKQRSYTPDFIVYYRKDRLPKAVPTIFEVKYRNDLKENWKEYKPKFKAALSYAKVRGWKFKIVTEVEIRTMYTVNATFLLPYKRRKMESTLLADILEGMRILKTTTPFKLLAFATHDEERRMELIPALWYLISQGMVGCDLEEKLHMESAIWHKK